MYNMNIDTIYTEQYNNKEWLIYFGTPLAMFAGKY